MSWYVYFGFIAVWAFFLFCVEMSRSLWWRDLSKRRRTRNKTLADYDLTHHLMGPVSDGVIDDDEVSRVLDRLWDLQFIELSLPTSRLSHEMHYYLRRRFKLADEVEHRIDRLKRVKDSDLEALMHYYGGE